MARLPRLAVAGELHHVVQRGHNRQPVFSCDDDYRTLHAMLLEQARAEGVAIHAWCMVEAELHLLATPPEPAALSRLMQGVGRRYVRHYNARTGRTGTLWEGRFRASVVQARGWLLPSMAFLDLEPVRAGLVEQAAQWAWSSHRHYVGLQVDPLVTVHPLFWELGDTPFARESAYASRVERGLARDVQAIITDAANHGWALGDAGFLAAMSAQAGRRTVRAQAGRPSKLKPA